MAKIKPFRAVRPKKELASKVAAPPYDVLDSEEARELAAGNPYTFLHVNKPEIDLEPGISLYDEKVYQKGAENFRNMSEKGILFQEEKPCLYIYQQIMGNHKQIGLVTAASVEEYEQNIIKKHELTRQEKEDDRVNHIRHLNAQVGPVFLTYKAVDKMDNFVEKVTARTPVYDFTSADQVRHTLWIIDNDTEIENVIGIFKDVGTLYVADGHHRSAAAQRVRDIRRTENPNHTGNEEYNYFLVVIFPHNQMQILDYNRVVKDLNGLDKEQFLKSISTKFDITEGTDPKPLKPQKTHEFSMYLDGHWYRLTPSPEVLQVSDPVKQLDVSILQENLLAPVLGIGDLRKDKRIDFVGGIRGLEELKKRVDSGKWAVAFAFYPTSIEELMTIADAGKIMPPKSTWFEPKLKSGLVVHLLD